MRRPSDGQILAVRSDNMGDVLLVGPALRALASSGREVIALVAERSSEVAAMLPGVAAVETFDAPWIDADPGPLERASVERLMARVQDRGISEAVIFTSFHQDPLPMALLLRLAGVRRIGAISEDYPGSLLDVRHRVPENIHEVQRASSLAAACGFPPPPGDDLRLRIHDPLAAGAEVTAPDTEPGAGYVVIHPGSSVPARSWTEAGWTALVAELTGRGHRVVLTGSRSEAELVDRVAAGAQPPGRVTPMAGRTGLAGTAGLLRAASVVAVGNTGPAHLAAAVGTPVVSLFPPTVPAVRWRPWGVPHVIVGRQDIGCRGCRARVCPRQDAPMACVADVDPVEVADALEALASGSGEPCGPSFAQSSADVPVSTVGS